MYLLKEAGKSVFSLLPGVSWLARSGHRALLYWRHFVCTMFTHSLTEQRFAARWRNAIIAMIIQMRENALLVAGMGWHPPRGVRSTRTMTTLARLNHRLNGQHISPQNERRAEIFLWSVLHLEKCPASIAGRKKSPSSSGRDDRDPLPPLIGAVPTFSTGINPAHFSGLCVCLLQKGTYYEPWRAIIPSRAVSSWVALFGTAAPQQNSCFPGCKPLFDAKRLISIQHLCETTKKYFTTGSPRATVKRALH